jgi:hypothetical protein
MSQKPPIYVSMAKTVGLKAKTWYGTGELKAETHIGVVGGSKSWGPTEIGGLTEEYREDLAKILVGFLLQYQPDQVIGAPDARVFYWLLGCSALRDGTPESRKILSEFFSKFSYSVEYDYEAFRNKIQTNPQEKHFLAPPLFVPSYDTFPKTATPYKVAIIYMGQKNISNLVARYSKAFENVSSGYGYFLWLIPVAQTTDGFEKVEVEQIREISNPIERVVKVLEILERIAEWIGPG